MPPKKTRAVKKNPPKKPVPKKVAKKPVPNKVSKQQMQMAERFATMVRKRLATMGAKFQ